MTALNSEPNTKFHGNGVYGGIDSPTPDTKLPRAEVSVIGHVFHTEGHVCDVKIFVNGKFIEEARWGLPRYDVYRQCLTASSYESGFVVRFGLEDGLEHEYELTALVTCDGREFTLGPVTFVAERLQTGDSFTSRPFFPAGAPGVFRTAGEEMLELMINEAGLTPSHSVLEIGCGMGRGALPLCTYLNADATYTGFDVMREAVEYCNANISTRYPNFSFFHLDVENRMYNPNADSLVRSSRIPLGSEAVECCFLWSVFTHIRPADIAAYLTEICRVLKPGGYLTASFFIMNQHRRDRFEQGLGMDFKPIEDFWTLTHDNPELAVCIDEDRLRSMYEDAGLVIEATKLTTGEPVIGQQDIVIAFKP